MLDFRFQTTTTNIRKVNKIIRMLIVIGSTILPKLPSRPYLCLAQEYLVVTVRLGEGEEKRIKIKEIKKGRKETYFCYLKEKSVYIS